MVDGGINDGVPPPKNMEVSLRPGVSAASYAISASNAAHHAASSTVSRTWLLKSQ
jgi:hypothetical protein